MFRFVLILLLAPFFCFANSAPFGLEIGRMRIEEFKEKYQVQALGTHRWGQGEMFSLSTKTINFEGLNKIHVIFDQNEIMVAVLTELDKSKFDSVLNLLNSKYRLIEKKIPFVGTKSAIFSDDCVQIELISEHLSFQMTMNYISKDFLKSCKEQYAKEVEETKQAESSQL